MSRRNAWRALQACLAASLAVQWLPITPAGAGPQPGDLIVRSVATATTTAAPGDPLSVEVTTANIGRRRVKASTTVFVLSTDATRSSDDVVLPGTQAVRALPPRKQASATVPLAVPASVPAGTYALVACADGTETVRESLETNNCLAAPAPIIIGVPTLGASSEEMIAKALAEERLDYPTSLLYRAYALFSNPALPEEFLGTGTAGHGTQLFGEVLAVWDQLPVDIQSGLQPYLLRPDEPGSAFAATAVATNATPTIAAATASGQECQTQNWSSAARDGGRTKVWLCPSNPPDPVADAALLEDALDLAEGLLERMTLPPPSGMGNARADTDGGDSRVDIYLLALNQCVWREGACRVNPAVAATYPTAFSENAFGRTVSSGFVVMNRERFASSEIKSDVAHELFHVLQNAHNYQGNYAPTQLVLGGVTQQDESWLVEATATWAEWYYAYEADTSYRDRFVQNFQPVTRSLLDNTDHHDYASFIWSFFAQQEQGGSGRAVFQAWVDSEPAANPGDIDKAVDLQHGFGPHFREFAVRNLNVELPGNPLGTLYRAQDVGFPTGGEAMPLVANRGTIVLAAAPPTDVGVPVLAASYDKFTVSDEVRELRFDFGQLGNAASADADVIANIRGEWKRFKLGSGKTLTLCRDLPEEDASELYAIVSNHAMDRDTDYGGPKAGEAVTGSYGLERRDRCSPYSFAIVGLSETVAARYDEGGRGGSSLLTEVFPYTDRNVSAPVTQYPEWCVAEEECRVPLEALIELTLNGNDYNSNFDPPCAVTYAPIRTQSEEPADYGTFPLQLTGGSDEITWTQTAPTVSVGRVDGPCATYELGFPAREITATGSRTQLLAGEPVTFSWNDSGTVTSVLGGVVMTYSWTLSLTLQRVSM